MTVLVYNCSNIPNVDLKQTRLLVLLNIDVDGEMFVDISHLVYLNPLVTPMMRLLMMLFTVRRGRDILSSTVVKLDGDDVFLGM